MARPKNRNPLTAREVDAAIRKAVAERKPRVSAGDNLYLELRSGTPKFWHFRYAFEGKQNAISFGDYEHVSLADARSLARQANGMLAKGEDPRLLGKKGRKAVPPAPVQHPFEEVAREWFAQRKGSRDQEAERKWLRAFETKLFPAIGHIDVKTLGNDRELFGAALMNLKPAYTRNRMMGRVNSIMKMAKARGWADVNPTTEIRETAGPAPRVQHHKALEARDLPEFLARIERINGQPIVKLAMRFVILTAVRTTEVAYAEWKEIEGLDSSEPLWRIPAVRFEGKYGMKARRPHLVPLSTAAVDVLQEAKALYPKSEIIFPSSRSDDGYLSENALLKLIERAGYKGQATTHGMRTLFRDVVSANKHFQDVWIEAQLSHLERDEVKSAYLRNAWMDHRREMMSFWGDYVGASRKSV